MESVRFAHLEELWGVGGGVKNLEQYMQGKGKITEKTKSDWKQNNARTQIPAPILGFGPCGSRCHLQPSWVRGERDSFTLIRVKEGDVCGNIYIFKKTIRNYLWSSVPSHLTKQATPFLVPLLGPAHALCASEVSPGEQLQIPQDSHVCPVKARS